MVVEFQAEVVQAAIDDGVVLTGGVHEPEAVVRGVSVTDFISPVSIFLAFVQVGDDVYVRRGGGAGEGGKERG